MPLVATSTRRAGRQVRAGGAHGRPRDVRGGDEEREPSPPRARRRGRTARSIPACSGTPGRKRRFSRDAVDRARRPRARRPRAGPRARSRRGGGRAPCPSSRRRRRRRVAGLVMRHRAGRAASPPDRQCYTDCLPWAGRAVKHRREGVALDAGWNGCSTRRCCAPPRAGARRAEAFCVAGSGRTVEYTDRGLETYRGADGRGHRPARLRRAPRRLRARPGLHGRGPRRGSPRARSRPPRLADLPAFPTPRGAPSPPIWRSSTRAGLAATVADDRDRLEAVLAAGPGGRPGRAARQDGEPALGQRGTSASARAAGPTRRTRAARSPLPPASSPSAAGSRRWGGSPTSPPRARRSAGPGSAPRRRARRSRGSAPSGPGRGASR